MAVSGLDWEVLPGAQPGLEASSRQRFIADSVADIIKTIPRKAETFQNLSDAILKGLAVVGLIWQQKTNGLWCIRSTYPVNKDRFVFTTKGELRLLSKRNPLFGERVPPYSFVPHVFNQDDGSFWNTMEAGYVFYGRGLADVLYHIFFFKTHAMKFWLKWLERFGSPVWVGRYSPPTDDTMRELMLNLLKVLRGNSEIAIPSGEGWDLETKEPSAMSRSTFKDFVDDYADKKIAQVILGQTSTTEAGEGGLALGKVHATTFGRIVAFDCQCLEDTVNMYLVRSIVDVNFGPQEYYPMFKFRLQEDRNTPEFVSTLSQLVNLGVKIPLKYVYDYTGIPQPAGEETVLTPPSAALALSGGAPTGSMGGGMQGPTGANGGGSITPTEEASMGMEEQTPGAMSQVSGDVAARQALEKALFG